MQKRPDDSDTVNELAATVPGVRAPQVDPLIGATFGSYRLVKLLGEGGMGAVYLGEHPAIGSRVAIKVLHPQFASDVQTVERFFNEARAVNLIGHENIVQISDFGVANGRHYFVMEFLAGSTLQQVLRGGKALPLSRAGPIALQCCRALDAAHEHGIVHRDFKPDNIFLVQRGGRADFVKLVDFGIAKLTDYGGGVKTQAGIVLGTPAYMSPEQAAGEGIIDARSDVYALGVVLFQMVTGRLPFGQESPSVRQILMAHLRDPPPSPRSIRPDLPSTCEDIVLCALEKDPERRFQSMAEFHEALAGCLDGEGLSLEPPPVPSVADAPREGPATGPRSRPGITPAPSTRPRPSGARKRTRRMGRAAALGALIGVAAVVGAYAIMSRPDRVPPPKPPIHRNDLAPPDEDKEPPKVNPSSPPTDATPPPIKPVDVVPPKPPVPPKSPPTVKIPPEKKVDPPAPEPVQLMLATQPAARFTAVWPTGTESGTTPKTILVPRGTDVFIRYEMEGYEPAVTKVTATTDQAVAKELKPLR